MLKISDFDAAVFGNVPTPHRYDIQSEQFYASEVLLKADWTYSADIWNLGMMASDFGDWDSYLRKATDFYFVS